MKLPALLLAASITVGTALGSGVAVYAAQTNMQDALRALTSARASLIAANPDKGGHRGQAIKLVNQAISEVNAGIGYATSHASR